MPFSDLGKDKFLEHLPERYNLGKEFFEDYGITSVKFCIAQNFTIVLVKTAKNDYFGIAKRSPADKDVPAIGLSIACSRAFKDVIGLDPKYGRQVIKRPAAAAEFCRDYLGI